MKKSYLILGGLCGMLLLAVLIILEPSPQRPETDQTPPFELTPITNILSISPSATPRAATPTHIATEMRRSPTQTAQPTQVAIPSHTVNGYTAAIESYYVDPSHVTFQVRVSGGDVAFGDEHFYDRIESPDLYDENGVLLNTSGGWEPAVDPSVYQFDLVPTTLLTGERLKGQFAFDLTDAPNYEKKLAEFRFDFDVPIYAEKRFNPKQTVSANGITMLLDSIAVTPAFTQVYLCLPTPSFDPWMIGSQTTVQIGDDDKIPLYNVSELFSSFTGNYWGIRSEPYWMPPTKDGSCFKIGFQTGSNHSLSFTLIIPELEKLDPDVLMTAQLLEDYPGLNPKEAYSTYLEEHGNTHKGPWIFDVELKP